MELELQDITNMVIEKDLAVDTTLNKKIIAELQIRKSGDVNSQYVLYVNNEILMSSVFLKKVVNKYNSIV